MTHPLGLPLLSQELPWPPWVQVTNRTAPSLPHTPSSRPPALLLQPPHAAATGAGTLVHLKGVVAAGALVPGTGWTSRDHTWPGQSGWGTLRLGRVSAVGGRGTGAGQNPTPLPRHPGMQGPGVSGSPLPKVISSVFPLDHAHPLPHIHLSSLRTLLCKNRVKNSPCLMGLE